MRLILYSGLRMIGIPGVCAARIVRVQQAVDEVANPAAEPSGDGKPTGAFTPAALIAAAKLKRQDGDDPSSDGAATKSASRKVKPR